MKPASHLDYGRFRGGVTMALLDMPGARKANGSFQSRQLCRSCCWEKRLLSHRTCCLMLLLHISPVGWKEAWSLSAERITSSGFLSSAR